MVAARPILTERIPVNMNTSPSEAVKAEAKKACPFCAETINVVAKLCPRCRQWLSYRSLRHPVVGACLMGILALTLLAVMVSGVEAAFDRIFNPKPYYTEFLDSLQVMSSQMNWVQTTQGVRIYMTGVLTNQSPVPWRDPEFECRFFDTNRVMVDVANTAGRLTILPHDDRAFRLVVQPGRPTNDYASYKLSVSTARNAKGGF
jgi:predicted nucleic acid-binding Zn ribbon protein